MLPSHALHLVWPSCRGFSFVFPSVALFHLARLKNVHPMPKPTDLHSVLVLVIGLGSAFDSSVTQ
jgi:hypothetical protein